MKKLIGWFLVSLPLIIVLVVLPLINGGIPLLLELWSVVGFIGVLVAIALAGVYLLEGRGGK